MSDIDWKARAGAAEAEMHARELHHFETEQENASLRAEVERLRLTPPASPHAQDGARAALWKAIGTVYERHDHTRPLNHVNWIEWVEAVEKAGTFHPAPVADPSGRS